MKIVYLLINTESIKLLNQEFPHTHKKNIYIYVMHQQYKLKDSGAWMEQILAGPVVELFLTIGMDGKEAFCSTTKFSQRRNTEGEGT